MRKATMSPSYAYPYTILVYTVFFFFAFAFDKKSKIIMNHFINNGFRGLSTTKWPLPCSYLAWPHCCRVPLPILRGALDVMWNYIDLTSSCTQLFSESKTSDMDDPRQNGSTHTVTSTTLRKR